MKICWEPLIPQYQIIRAGRDASPEFKEFEALAKEVTRNNFGQKGALSYCSESNSGNCGADVTTVGEHPVWKGQTESYILALRDQSSQTLSGDSGRRGVIGYFPGGQPQAFTKNHSSTVYSTLSVLVVGGGPHRLPKVLLDLSVL